MHITQSHVYNKETSMLSLINKCYEMGDQALWRGELRAYGSACDSHLHLEITHEKYIGNILGEPLAYYYYFKKRTRYLTENFLQQN